MRSRSVRVQRDELGELQPVLGGLGVGAVHGVDAHHRVELLLALALAGLAHLADDRVAAAQAVLAHHRQRDVHVLRTREVPAGPHERVVVEHVEDAGRRHQDVVVEDRGVGLVARAAPGRLALLLVLLALLRATLLSGLLLARLVRRALAVPAAPAAVAAAAALLRLGLLALLGLALLVLVLLLALLAVLLGLPLLAGLLGARLGLLLLALLAVVPLLAVLLVLLLLRLRRLGLLLRLRRLRLGSGLFSRTGVPAALIASTSCGFFMEPAPLMPRPFAIAFRSATSMVERPPARFLGAVVASGVSVT